MEKIGTITTKHQKFDVSLKIEGGTLSKLHYCKDKAIKFLKKHGVTKIIYIKNKK